MGGRIVATVMALIVGSASVCFGTGVASGAPGQIRTAQTAQATTGAGVDSSITATFASPTAKHHLLVLVAVSDGSVFDSISSVSDTAGNTWHNVLQTGFFDPGHMETEIWYAANAAPVASVTASWAPFSGHLITKVYDFTGADRVSPPDGFSTGSQALSATSCTSTPVNPSGPNDVAVGMLVGDVHQPITVTSSGFKNAKQLSAGGPLVLRSGVAFLTTTDPVSYAGSSTNQMGWSCFVAAFSPR
jgi:hypothetical protein